MRRTVFRVIAGVLNRLKVALWRLTVNKSRVQIGKNVKILGLPILQAFKESTIEIGDRVVLVSDSRYTALGVSHPTILRTLRTSAEIIIGPDCGLSGTTICSSVSVRIGKRCLIGADVSIMDTDFHNVDSVDRRYQDIPTSHVSDSVIIGDDVFIGARTIILKGVRIGNGAVIGAGSILSSNVQDNEIFAGNPAKLLRRLKIEKKL